MAAAKILRSNYKLDLANFLDKYFCRGAVPRENLDPPDPSKMDRKIQFHI